MKCPKCLNKGYADAKHKNPIAVVYVDQYDHFTRRVHRCRQCGYLFKTTQTIDQEKPREH